MKYGAEKEDAEVFFPLVNFSLRYVNHFHDPLSGEGLHDGLSSGLSAMAWAQDGASQENAVEGDQSWANLRALYYQALTAASEENRQAGFAQLFKGLGHQMHLVQDMAVPAHVRNDAHAEDTLLQVNREQWNDYPHLPLFFERWAKKNDWVIATIASKSANAFVPALDYDTPDAGNGALLPISQLWDANRYDGTNPSADLAQGLAEYTNANFFSSDTIFADELNPDDPHFFPYPKVSSTNFGELEELIPVSFVADDGKLGFKLYVTKDRDGETIERFVRVGYFYKQLRRGQVEYRRTLYLDEACHAAYVQKLVPRAVGYSTALLDYFFRGQMEATALPFFLDNKMFFLRLSITNTTATRETMRDGTFSLVLRYRPHGAAEDGSQDIVVPALDRIPVNALGFNETTDIDFYFDYNQNIPIDRWDTMQATLVFTGTMGNEIGAVAGKVFTPGRVLFNEEWDKGFAGNYPWQSSLELQDTDEGIVARNVIDKMLIMENIRYDNRTEAWGNDWWVDLAGPESEGVLIGPGAHVQFIVPEMTSVLADPYGACHILEFIFNDALALQYSATQSFLPGRDGIVHMSFTPGKIISDNIHDIARSAGIALPDPLYLTSIVFLQQVYRGHGEYRMEMVTDAVRIVDQNAE